MSPRRLTRAWIGLIFLVLGLALFPKGVKDAVLRTQGTQNGTAPLPARASLKTGIAFLARFAAIVLLTALATGALVLSFVWHDLIVQHGYWGAIQLIGEWKVLLALALTTAVVAIPIGAALAILGVLIGGFFAFARHALKK